MLLFDLVSHFVLDIDAKLPYLYVETKWVGQLKNMLMKKHETNNLDTVLIIHRICHESLKYRC